MLDIKTTSSSKLEIYFITVNNSSNTTKEYIARIKIENKYTDQIYDLIKSLKNLENDSRFWTHDLITLQGLDGLDKKIDVFSLIPFLAEGEQIIWQNLKFEATNIKKKVIALDVVTNYRILQYDYEKHIGEAIMFLSLGNVNVTNQQVLVSSNPNGTYSHASEKIIGISNVKTNNVVGDITFYLQDKAVITFTQVTDPDTLYIATNILKDRYSSINIRQREKEKELKCNKCGKDGISKESKFCNDCGSQLSNFEGIFDDSTYGDKITKEGDMILSREYDLAGRYENLRKRIDNYKPYWDRYGVIQFKTPYMAILKREWGTQVEFIIAFDDLTREGYRLMAVDEGKSGGDSAGGITGGLSAYFYFQNMKYVK